MSEPASPRGEAPKQNVTRCAFCAYAPHPWDGPITPAPEAVAVVETEKGPRALCAGHAALGRWEPRMRRVGRVSP